MSTKENRAVNAIKSYPRYFYSYAKRFSKLRSNVGPIKDNDGTLHQNPGVTANILQEQYCSVFSDPDSKKIVMDHKGLPQGNEKCLADIEFSSVDIVVAIDELDSFVATADEDIPTSILKGCKEALSIPLTMKWSMTNGIVPPSLKEQFINPSI